MDFLIDIGNVLLTFDFIPSFQKLMPPGTKNPQEKFDLLIERKDAFEAGHLSADEYIEWASETLEFTGSRETFIDAWCHIFTRNEAMWNLMKKLKADGHRLIVFSNTNALHGPSVCEEHPDFTLFDELIFSYQTGYIKPQPDIYQHAIETYQLDPKQTYYIDDLVANIQGGEAFGINSFLYDVTQHQKLLDWLSEHKILSQHQ